LKIAGYLLIKIKIVKLFFLFFEQYLKTKNLLNMKLTKALMAIAIVSTVSFVSCKPKDADIKTAIETKMKAMPDMMGVTVDVKDGVASIGGMCKDDACKASCEKAAAEVKGVKSVINNCTVTPPPIVAPPASLTTVLDAATQQKVKDGLKDIKGVTVEFAGEKAVLTGTVTKADRMKIMQMLSSAKVQSDVSKLMDKK
jgi:hyperosmotically inducible periplasmic protein